MAQQLPNKFIRFAAGFMLVMFCAQFAYGQKIGGNVIYFDLNVPSLNAAARQTVDEMVKANKIKKNQRLLLYGYADYLGTRAHNDSLSTERAMNVRAYLIGKGIPESNITVCVGKGQIDREPGKDHKGYAKDRKVEIITDAAKMKKFICRPLAKCKPLQWSKNVSKLNVHAVLENIRQELTDNTVTVRLPNGDKYIGEISSDGTKVNNGTYIWAGGEKYKGSYKDDRKSGEGVYYWPNGDRLDGTWKDDEIVAGTLTIPYDGVMYHADSSHSHSDVVYKGNLQYTGAFADHMFNGQGMAVWPNGDRYKGNWHNDKMDGQGTYIWSTREIYEGQWKDNKMNGHGVMYSASGTMLHEGNWENDVFKGK